MSECVGVQHTGMKNTLRRGNVQGADQPFSGELMMAVYRVSNPWRSNVIGKRVLTQTRTWAMFACEHCGTFFVGQLHNAAKNESCGCKAGELIANSMTGNRRGETHGKSESLVYGVWSAMRQRCENPKAAWYENYGGRGIRVCERWKSFANFLEDMGIPEKGMCIDRIDNDGDYEPENCRWVTRKQNQGNRRVTVRICIDGVEKTLVEWVEHFGIVDRSVANSRIHQGWDPLKALTTPSKKRTRKEICA